LADHDTNATALGPRTGQTSSTARTGPVERPSAEAIQTWLRSQIAELLEVRPDEIDVHEQFASYGFSSRDAVTLSGDLETWLDRPLSATLAFEYPTIDSLARFLAGGADVSAAGLPDAIGAGAVADSVAIVGIGCRIPGARSPEAFWQLLRDGVDAISEIPSDRWDWRDFYDPDPTAPGKMNSRWGGFLEQVGGFDPGFFGIAPREAVRMDPQQRLLLEVAWEGLEDAGLAPDRLADSRTGVFIGISSSDYGQRQFSDTNLSDAYAGTGNALSIAANRLSYFFGLRGPSLAVDTACSSSLVAVHLACQSLQSGESTLALAGGVNLILSPAITINFTKAGFMAPDGRCKAFDAGANGYVRSEGAGVVVLKPLSRALSDGDRIYAVIRGSAINQDGRTNGLTAPSRRAQEDVLRDAYRRAGVSPGRIQYVEAHGTGTILGDPIEAKALGTVLAEERPPSRPCAVGSVKTNVGHLEAAAGIAGLIKVALSLKHRAIPPSLHFHEPNPHIPFDELPLRVQQKLAPWPDSPDPALAGVSSFGFGGTNAHVVLEEPPATLIPVDEEPKSARVNLLPISARGPGALRDLVRSYRDWLAADPPAGGADPRNVCYSAALRRAHHTHRLAVMGHGPTELVEHRPSLVGIDSVNIDDLADQTRPAHTHLLERQNPGLAI